LVELDRNTYRLSDLLHSIAAPFFPATLEKGICLDVQADNQVDIVCDKTRLQIVLSNLLDNALKFTHPGGTIEVSGKKHAGQVIIEVRDNGVGIAAEDLPHIFERFYRGRTTEKGSGLGLAIVYSNVQTLGGSVKAESQPGQGSRFTITLP
jgi:signal transduction histidine kinase